MTGTVNKSTFIEKLKKGDVFSSFSLHIIAMALMLCDHVWATVLPGAVWLTCIGRISFPIFAFMISEGFFRTRNVKRYLLRMLLLALISELPFDLMYGGRLFYPYHQNVAWTYLIGLLLMAGLEKVRSKRSTAIYILACIAASVLGFAAGMLTMADYYGAGVLLVLCFYFFHKRNVWNLIAQLAVMYYVFVELIGGYYYPVTIFGMYFELQQEAFSILALIPIWLYNGRQGYHSRGFRTLCYAFYPVHILLLVIAAYISA